MNKIKDTITGATGIAGIGTTEAITNNTHLIQEGGSIIIQLMIGIVTLIKLLKRKKNETN